MGDMFAGFCPDDDQVEDDDGRNSEDEDMKIHRANVENLTHDDCVDTSSARMAGRGEQAALSGDEFGQLSKDFKQELKP